MEVLGRGVAWLDTGSPTPCLEAAEFVQVIQHRQRLKISCLEEISYNKQWISKSQLLDSAREVWQDGVRGLLAHARAV